MSMLSAQCDKLRQMAESVGLAMPQAATLMMEAADTILELRDDLQQANDAVRDAEHDESMAWDRVRKAEAEADKLLELVRDMWEGYNDPRCEECHLKDTPTCADCPICAREAAVIDRMRELGVDA